MLRIKVSGPNFANALLAEVAQLIIDTAQFLFPATCNLIDLMKQNSFDNLQSNNAVGRCINKFLFYFKKGYLDTKYVAWEREYKWNAHLSFQEQLNKGEYIKLLQKKEYNTISEIAVRIESKTNLLFSFVISSTGGALHIHLL